ncbi:MAG: hypothetical protein A2173_11670 [Planctomycetes bacterium RBG_13_44_8b]|nr:MAG: hypothetical protein A2173_11670 [Planctomycetes bacterium RBG_13_44_8b]
MNEQLKKDDKLLETTDCLEAVGTLRSIKNLLFLVIFICLLILQGAFWLVPTEYVSRPGEEPQKDVAPVTAMLFKLSVPAGQDVKVTSKTEKIEKAAQNLTADANAAKADPNAVPAKHYPQIKIEFSQLSRVIRVCNYLLVVSSILYSLTLLFAMKVSLVGRLGGISHITKATFLSFAVVVLILPWQLLFKTVGFGLIYTPSELLEAWENFEGASVPDVSLMIFRFSVFWLLVLMLLISAQWRSMCWSRNTLKRLGIVG